MPTLLSPYCLVAYSPWEGLRIAVTGDKGRIEMDIRESITHLLGDGGNQGAQASKGTLQAARMRVFPMHAPYEVDVPVGDGGHGGADPGHAGADIPARPTGRSFGRAASHIDGGLRVLVGIAANESMRTGAAGPHRRVIQPQRADGSWLITCIPTATSTDPAQRHIAARCTTAKLRTCRLFCPHARRPAFCRSDYRWLADRDVADPRPLHRCVCSIRKGVAMEDMAIPQRRRQKETERDHRRAWQRFADHFTSSAARRPD